MKEEQVNLSNIEFTSLANSIKAHLKELGLEIIHEDNHENFWNVKAHKGGKLAIVTGSIRDVEIMISGTGNSYSLILRTGAWGRDIAIPALLASTFSLGAGVAVAGVEVYRAHKFEKNFWDWLNQQVRANNAIMSEPVATQSNTRVCIKCNSALPLEAKFCLHCGAGQ